MKYRYLVFRHAGQYLVGDLSRPERPIRRVDLDAVHIEDEFGQTVPPEHTRFLHLLEQALNADRSRTAREFQTV